MNAIQLIDIKKKYFERKVCQEVLRGINLSVQDGEMVAIMGKSGAGKSTLLSIISGLEIPDSGKIYIYDEHVVFSNHQRSAKYRKDKFGIIVQNYALINELNVFDNVALPLWQLSLSKSKVKQLVMEILDQVEMSDKIHREVRLLSGGEKQRIAIARACVMKPPVLLADEPTGALDKDTEYIIMNLLCSFNRAGKTIIMVTHDEQIGLLCSKTYRLIDGVLQMS